MEKELKLKVKLTKGGKLPTKSYKTDTGFDIYSAETVFIEPVVNSANINIFTVDVSPAVGEIRTGLIFAEIPEGYGLTVRARSSWHKKGLFVLPSTIDNGFRYEYSLWVINFSNNLIKISEGERVAQLILEKVPTNVEIEEVSELTISDRNTNQHGSTGK